MSETPPTRVAVALKYEFADGAPVVTAKGEGAIAEKIIEVAREHEIAIEENPVLAQALSQIDLDQEIPVPLYKAVAEVIGFVLKTGRLKRPDPATRSCPRIGRKARGLDAGNGGGLIVVRGVAGDPDRTDHDPLLANEHAARHRHQRAIGDMHRSLDEGGTLRRHLAERAAARTHGQRTMRLRIGHFRALQRGIVFRQHHLALGAGIKHHDGERLELVRTRVLQGGVGDLAGLGEGEHGEFSRFWARSRRFALLP